MGKVDGYDVHCHIFNLSYALREIKAMFFDKVTGRYPEEIRPAFRTPEERERSESDFRKKLFRIVELFTSTVRTEKGNFTYLQEKIRDTWGIEAGAIPLMMDIYYFFAPPVTENTSTIPAMRDTDFREVILNEKKMEDDFTSEIKRFAEDLKNRNRNKEDFKEFKVELDRCLEESLEDRGYRFEISSPQYGDLKLTSGFLFHLERLRKLVIEGARIFPFLATDPRRPGIRDALRNENLIGKKGPFYGVKLYPRLGFHPASKPVQDILDICIERDLPVTTHCGMSGFPSKSFSLDGSGTWKYNDYGNPVHFEPALRKGLRIDFAHMGSCDPDFKWAKTIVKFMRKYGTVYSDLSCYTDKQDLLKIIQLFGKDSSFKKRIMFGSDFDVMSFTDEKISLEQYCRNFSDMFPDDIQNMRYTNVVKFLKL